MLCIGVIKITEGLTIKSYSSDPCIKIQFGTKVKSLIFSENGRHSLQFETKVQKLDLRQKYKS